MIYSLLAFFVAFIAIYLLLRLPEKLSVLDKPNSRSLHSKPVSRLGGIAILLGIFVSGVFYSESILFTFDIVLILAGLVLTGVISFVDDMFTLGSAVRLLIQLVASSLVVYAGLDINFSIAPFVELQIPVYLAVLISILYIVWMIHLYNFMDGIDGLAGGMATIGFTTFAIIGFIEGHQVFVAVNLIIASSSLGFLFWNYPPAKLFMGDSGSSTLGFLLAVISLWASGADIVPIWMSLVIFSPFIVDATVTLLIRLFKRERICEAHKSHFYQLVADSGMGRRKLLHCEYVMMLLCSVAAIVLHNTTVSVQVFAILLLILVYIYLIYYIKTKITVMGMSI